MIKERDCDSRGGFILSSEFFFGGGNIGLELVRRFTGPTIRFYNETIKGIRIL
jgi:hypothetical protein